MYVLSARTQNAPDLRARRRKTLNLDLYEIIILDFYTTVEYDYDEVHRDTIP